MTLHAVDVSPSRYRASIAYAARFTQLRLSSDASCTDDTSSYASTESSSTNSGAAGPGYHAGKVLAMLGQVVYFFVEDTVIIRRARSCLRWLKQSKSKPFGTVDRKWVLNILEDALHMSL